MPTKQELEQRVQQLQEENAILQERLDDIMDIAAPPEEDQDEEEENGEDEFEDDDQGED
jgi:hypothetical protein